MAYGNNSGGYMDTSFDGSSNNNTSSTGTYARKPMGEQTLRPLTVKQIKNCTIPQEGTFRVDNADVTQVTIVGVIRSIQELATNIVYTVEDGTGAIDVRKWVEQNETPEEADLRRKLLVDTYVRVNGRLNSFGSRTTIVSHAIRPITDFNEVTYHFLDVIDTHLKFVKHTAGGTLVANNSSSAMDIDSGNGAKFSITERVSQIIQSFDDVPEGCSIDQILFKLKGMHTEAEIRDTVVLLQNEGQCYTTVDDDHVKSCLP